MPIIVFTAFYIPVGLQIMAHWLSKRSCRSRLTICGDRHRWFFILLTIGMIICIAKFTRMTPLRGEKQGYLHAVEWMEKNTKPEDIIAGTDVRIGFYAQRPMRAMETLTNSVKGGEIVPGQWYHLVGTYDGSDQRLYVNAQLVAADKPAFTGIAAGHNRLAIGKPFVGANSYFKGVIDEVCLYRKALTEKEIEALYNNQVAAVEKQELIGYWPLDDNAPDRERRPHKATEFDDNSDYLDLSHLDLGLDVDNLSVVLWVKSEMSNNWIIGNRDQFRIGINNCKAHFWIRDGKPGRMIPEETAYVVQIIGREQSDLNPDFDRSVKKRHSIWVNKREKKRRIVIYEVL